MNKPVLSLAAALAVITFGAAGAQDFPSKPISMVMPYAAGGPGDTITRIVAQSMGANLKPPIIVENIAGAGGTIGSQRVASSAPDGHSLLMIHISQATNPFLYPNLRYDVVKDFEPIGLVADLPSVFVGRKALPASDFGELISYLKSNPGKATYAHAGVAPHRISAAFCSRMRRASL